jgi:hypothetical protein
MNKQIYETNETKEYRVESIKGAIYNLRPIYAVDSMMMKIPKGSSLIVEQRNVSEFHPDMFSAILLSNTPKLRIVAISFNDVTTTGIKFEG